MGYLTLSMGVSEKPESKRVARKSKNKKTKKT